MGGRLEPGYYIVEDLYYDLLDTPTKLITAEEQETLAWGGVIEYEGEFLNIYDGPFKLIYPDQVPQDVRDSISGLMAALRSISIEDLRRFVLKAPWRL